MKVWSWYPNHESQLNKQIRIIDRSLEKDWTYTKQLTSALNTRNMKLSCERQSSLGPVLSSPQTELKLCLFLLTFYKRRRPQPQIDVFV